MLKENSYNDLFSWQKVIYQKLLHLFQDDNVKIIRLKGERGSGKETIIRAIASSPENDNLTFLYFRYNEFLSENGLAPFIDTLVDKLKRGAGFSFRHFFENSAKDVPLAGNTLSYLFSSLIPPSKVSPYLDDKSASILVSLHRIVGEKQFVLVFKDVESYDVASLKLFRLLMSGTLNKIYPYLKNMKILYTNENDEEKDIDIDASARIQTIEMIPPSLENIDELFAKLNHGFSAHTDMNKLIIKLANGNIHHIKYILDNVESLSSAETGDINKDTGLLDIMNIIIQKRLTALGEDGLIIDEALSTASFIGNEFYHNELQRLLNKNEERIIEILSMTNRLYLTEEEQEKIRFSHEIIQRLFYNKNLNNHRHYHYMVAECLRFSRPYEYFMRGEHYFEAQKYQDALIMFIVGYLRYIRNGLVVSQKYIEKLHSLLCSSYLKIYFTQMTEAYQLINTEQYRNANKLLNEMDDALPKLLRWEKEYLLSYTDRKLCERTKDEINEVISRLEVISSEAFDDENEFWWRINAMLISFYVNFLDDVEKARKTEKILMEYCADNQSHDPNLEINKNILYRKAASMHPTAIAAKRTGESVRFFKETNMVAQYLMSLNNHTGNLFSLSEYEKAYEYIAEASGLLKESQYNFVNKYYILNNLAISSFYAKKATAKETCNALYDAVSVCEDNDIKIVLLNNLGVFQLIAGYTLKSQINFKHALMLNQGVDSKYYSFLLYSNLTIYNFITDNTNSARSMHEKACNIVSSIYDKYEHLILKKRSELITSIINSGVKSSLARIDKTIRDSINLSTSEYLTRALLLTDLQFWSE